jgi:hypothetical protein
MYKPWNNKETLYYFQHVEDNLTVVVYDTTRLVMVVHFNPTLHLEYKKAVPPHARKALGGRGGTAPTHSRSQH